MMGQQQEMVAEQQAGGTLRRIIVAFIVAAILAAMMALTASQAYAGSGYAKGQDNTNPGRSVNNKVGDVKNDVANPNCDPFDRGKSNNENGGGCENN